MASSLQIDIFIAETRIRIDAFVQSVVNVKKTAIILCNALTRAVESGARKPSKN